jgi:glutathione S-transferase
MTPTDSLRLYDYTASANCLKVRMLLAQLEQPYERVPVDIFAGDTLTDEYAAINPARSTPVLQIGASTYLSESNAILVYLADGTPLFPDDALRRAEVVRWLILEQTDVMPSLGGLRFRLLTGRLAAEDRDALRRRKLGDAALAALDRHLHARDFLVDTYSIADIAVYAYTHVAPEAGYELAAYPAVERWLERVEEQPRFVNDLAPYPENARPGASTSIYDA